MTVTLALYDGRAKVKPDAYLGRDFFDKYRRACEAGGATYHKDLLANLAELDAVPRLRKALEQAGFAPRIAPELSKALLARAKAARGDLLGATARIKAIQGALKAQGLSLWGFQEVGAGWLAPRARALLADEMGLGKTIQILMALAAGVPVLVVCPASLKGNWQREANKWRPDFAVEILTGRGSFRWPRPGEIVIINYDILPPTKEAMKDSICALPGFENAIDPPADLVLVADECHAIKSPKAIRTQRLRAIIKKAARAWGSTGTPLMNRREELASLLQSFGLFEDAFGSWLRFIRVMNGKKKHFGGFEWGEPTPEAITALKRVMLRRRRDQVLPDLPTKTWQRVPVEIDKAAAEAGEAAREALAAAGIDLREVIREQKGLGKAFEVIAKARKLLAIAKIPALLDAIEEYEQEEEPLVVFSAHVDPIKSLATREGWGTITGETPAARRGELVTAFQAGQLKGIAMTIDTGGVGFTLTRAHHALFVDQEWTPAANSQAEDRICRIGQDKGCVIKILVAPDTIDEDVAELLMEKQKVINATVEAATAVKPEAHVSPEDLEAAAAGPAPAPKPAGPPVLSGRREAKSPVEMWAKKGLFHLAANDKDRAVELNDIGFNRYDNDFGHSLAEQAAGKGLTDRQWIAAVSLARKYRRQIGDEPQEAS